MTVTSSLTDRVCVLIEGSDQPDEVLRHAFRSARDLSVETELTVEVEALVLGSVSEHERDRWERLRRSDAVLPPGRGNQISLTVTPLSASPDDRTGALEALFEVLEGAPFKRLVVSGDSTLPVETLRQRLGPERVELAPVDRRIPRRPLEHRPSLKRALAVFGVTYSFYLALGGFTGGTDYVTGALSAGVVAVLMSSVAFSETPKPRRTGIRLVRLVLVAPVFAWEIAKANVMMAGVILHPKLPITPGISVFDTDTRGGLERMTLATLIGLTPGTLAIQVSGRTFTVHSMTPEARRDLESGRLERLVAWVFHGRVTPEGVED